MKRRLPHPPHLLYLACLMVFALHALPAYSLENGPVKAGYSEQTTPPEILNVPEDITVSDTCSMPPRDSLEVLDAEDGILPKVFPVDEYPDGITPCTGFEVFRIWEAEDSDGNITRDTQVITILPDIEAPVSGFNVSLDTIVACEFATESYGLWKNRLQLAVNSNASDCYSISDISDDFPASPFSPDPCDTLVVTITLTDLCSNIRAYTGRFITLDTTAPVLMNLPAGDTLEIGCDTLDQYLMDNPAGMVTVTDCTPGLVVAYQEDTLPSSNPTTCSDREFDLRRSWSVTDPCGNNTTAIQLLKVRDERAPGFTVPPDTTISCELDYTDINITGTVLDTADLCGGPVELEFDDVKIEGPEGCSQNFMIRRTWRATDECGNTSIPGPQIITVIDTVAPTFLLPADTTVDCGKESDLTVTGEPTMLMDNCGSNLTSSVAEELIIPGSCLGEFTIERTWRVEDGCGNATDMTQTINVIDTIPPSVNTTASSLTVTCAAGASLQRQFDDWIQSRGGALAADLCTPQDSLKWIPLNAGTSSPASMELLCPAPGDTIVLQVVDFIVVDECGLADTTTATFIAIDNTAPVISSCPQDEVIPTGEGVCEASYTLQPPLVEEECAASLLTENLSLNAVLTADAPSGQLNVTPVNPVELNFTVTAPLPVNVEGDAMLRIQLLNADAEGETEFLKIFGEDGQQLGKTARAPSQCSNSDTTLIIPVEKINAWALDGIITIRLEPNIEPTLSGGAAVNAICSPDSRVQAGLTFTTRDFAKLDYQYRINSGAAVSVSPLGPVDVILPTGENTITYYVRDCAGNVDSCTYKVRVEDLEPPILDCPDDISVGLEEGACSAFVALPFPDGVTDNCGVAGTFSSTLPLDTASAYLVFAADPDLDELQAQPKTFSFTDLAANAVGSATFTLKLRGDFNSNGAFLRILGDSGNELGSTSVGIASCNNPGEVNFSIPADTFNLWASDGAIQFQLLPNEIQAPTAMPGDGINPCDPMTLDGEVDSISYVFATLSYNQITPFYFAEGATQISYTQMAPPAITPTHEFNVGETTVSYVLPDNVGNLDTCSFLVTVMDNEPPVALCQATIVEINPSGLDVDTVSVADFNAGSFDNCLIDTMYLTPNTFTCEQAGTTVMATLTVIDQSGNAATCTKPIRIESEAPNPTYSPGICGGDTLYLFANPPQAEGGVVYTYRWFNPFGQLISTQQNPIIPNVDGDDSGAYVLRITGLTGCTAEEVVNVTVTNQPLTPAISTRLAVCSDEDIRLASTITLNNAIYRWYRGVPGSGTLLASTTMPEYTVSGPHPEGTQRFYLTIEANGCLSEPSTAVAISSVDRPVAVVNDDEITICEGEPIVLGTLVNGVTYQWAGPDGFSSTSQLPTVINEATLDNAGAYRLTVTRNGCSSFPDTTLVIILPKPPDPVLTVDSGPVCEGGTVVLKTLPAGASTYHWVSPNLEEFVTSTNQFSIPNATGGSAGQWRVYTKKFGCRSDDSNTTNVVVNTVPNAMASASPATVCERSRLELFATPGISGASYQWTGPNGYMSVAQNPVVNSASMSNQGTYTVRVTTTAGCTNTASVEVNVLESVSILAVSNDAPACLAGPTDVQLKATVFPQDNGSYSYEWTGPGYTSSDSCALIPNATAANNGNYQLVVESAEGCRSMPASTFVNSRNAPQVPAPPTVAPSTPAPFCSGEQIVLRATPYTGMQVDYHWLTPGGNITTSTETLAINGATPDDSGPYQLYVTVNGCASDTSGILPVNVNPIPSAVAASNSPVCEGETLRLFANTPSGASYEWTGPISSSLSNPTIPSADPLLHTGTYRVVVTVNGCSSNPATTQVVVEEAPATPMVSNNGPGCMDAGEAGLLLSVSTGSATPGATYTWYNNAGDTLGMTANLNLLLSDFSSLSAGVNTLYAEARLGECISEPSPPTTVQLDTIPDIRANAGMDTSYCVGAEVLLQASPPAIGGGHWAQVEGDTANVSIEAPNGAVTQVTGLEGSNTYTFTWSLSSGACIDYSLDSLRLRIDEAEDAFAGEDLLICAGEQILLQADTSFEGTGRWRQSAIQSDFNVSITDSTSATTTVTGNGVRPGNIYVFTWVVNSECGESSDDVFITVSDNNPSAGPDQVACNDTGDAVLMAEEPAEGSSGRWSSPDGSLLFANRNMPQTTISNLAIGDNLAIWTLDGGFCGEASRDTVVVNYQENPVAADDEMGIEFAIETPVNVLANDEVPPNSFINILQGPARGNARVISDSEISYLPDADFVGEDQIIYEVCSDGCECSEAVLTLRVGEDVACEAPSIITPNNDGINDLFIVPCLLDEAQFPDSEVQIFNRWGDEVFNSPKPYRNNWDGTFNGEELPADTYFYIVNFGDGREPLAGYLLIQR